MLGAGLTLQTLDDRVTVKLVNFVSETGKYGLAPDDEIVPALVPAEGMSRYCFAIPALLLLAGIFLRHLR